MEEPPLDAGTIAGLLADPARRAVVAALVLGATSDGEVAAATGLPARRLAEATGRLLDAGLLERAADGSLALDATLFGLAARAAAARREVTGPQAASAEQAKVLRAFVRDGRLVSIPTQRSKRLVVLELLSQEFEPGRHYSEAMVNLILGRWHPDTAALRRYLVDEGFLDREAGTYWRSGGPVDTSRP